MERAACELNDRDDVIAAYVTGRLTAAQLESYEQHILTCPFCVASVQQASELHAAFRRRAVRRRYTAVAALGVTAAAVLTAVMLQPSAVQRLGRVEPPRVAAMDVRTDLDSAAHYAARGVAAYSRGDYVRASAWLARAQRQHPQAGTAFYLASALLAAHQPDSAIAVFREVLRQPSSSYTDEAHYYAAKAWLQLDRADSAAAHLAAATASNHQLTASARALLDSLADVR